MIDVLTSSGSSRFPEASGKQQSWDRHAFLARRYALTLLVLSDENPLTLGFSSVKKRKKD